MIAHWLLLFGAGLLAGAMNALAGGGSFVSLPALIAVGIPSVEANASSTVALWPGSAVSAWSYHRGFEPVCGMALPALLAATVLGGLAGSLLLLWTPASAFDVILPCLLLAATLAMAFARRLGAALAGWLAGRRWPVLAVQFTLGLYGGYFGGAVGLMMVACWAVLGESDIKALNAPRTLLVTAANTIALLAFVLAGAVVWAPTLVMLTGGVLGGSLGARLGGLVSPRVARVMTLLWTGAITLVFFLRAYGG